MPDAADKRIDGGIEDAGLKHVTRLNHGGILQESKAGSP
jgi:hypothetical protein